MGEAVDGDGQRVVLIGIDEITEEESNTMADEYRMALEGLLRKAEMEGDADFLREGVRVMSQVLMEWQVSRRYLSAESLAKLYEEPELEKLTALLTAS